MAEENRQLSLTSEFRRWFDAPMTYPELMYALHLIDLKLANAIPELHTLNPLNQVSTGGMQPGLTYAQEPWSAILDRCAGVQTQWSQGAPAFGAFGAPPAAPASAAAPAFAFGAPASTSVFGALPAAPAPAATPAFAFGTAQASASLFGAPPATPAPAAANAFAGNARSAAAYIEARQKHIQQHIDQRRASMQQLLIEVAEAKKHMEASLEIPQHLPRYVSDRGQVQVSAEWEPLAHILLSNNVFPFPAVVNSATGDNSPYAMRGHSHQTGFTNAPAYVSLLEKLRKAQEEYSEHTAPELWKIKIRLLERMCKFDSDAALAVKREQEIERMEQETATAERAAEEARQRAEAMREKMNSARR